MEFKISFAVITYKRYKELKEAITSVLKQQYKNIEIIVVSDGHDENNQKIIEEFNDNRIKYYESNGGYETRNASLQLSTGDFVVFLDDDNLIYENFLEILVPLLHSNLGMLIYKINLYNDTTNGKEIPCSNEIKIFDIDTLNIVTNLKIAKQIDWVKDEIYPGQSDYVYFKKCENITKQSNYEIKYIDNVLAIHRHF